MRLTCVGVVLLEALYGDRGGISLTVGGATALDFDWWDCSTSW